MYAGASATQRLRYWLRPEPGWTAAARIIAEGIDRDERTIYRIVDDYERASHLPAIVLEAMEAQRLDPAAPKNAPMVQKLMAMPKPQTPKQAEVVVAVVHSEHGLRRKEAKAAKKPYEENVDEFAARILRHFKDRFGTMAAQQRDNELLFALELIVNSLRSDIRELRQYSRPALVPKPVGREVA
jgi:hypothetical protein